MAYPCTPPVCLVLIALVGCGPSAAPVVMTPQIFAHGPGAEVLPSADDVHLEPLAAGVTARAPACTEGAFDTCNGLDDVCDARIDEGCGWESGSIQITLAWQTGADLDLYVVDPTGYTISYIDRAAPDGGRLDHDARGACIPGSDTVENVFWSAPSPPRGRFAIDVHYWGECGSTGPTPAQVSVSVMGRIIGVYDFTIAPGQRQSVAVFTL